MEPCCKYDFGLYPHNADIVLDNLYADADGTYKILVQLPGGSYKQIDIEAKAGDELIIPQGQLNEDAVINFQAFDMHNIPMLMNDCASLKLQTYINPTLKCHGNSCDDISDSSNYYGGPYGYS